VTYRRIRKIICLVAWPVMTFQETLLCAKLRMST